MSCAHRWLLMAVMLGLTGCQAQPAPTASPELEVYRVGVTPAFARQVEAWAGDFQAERAEASIWIEELPVEAGLEALEDGSLELLITARPPSEEMFAAALAEEPLAVVLGPGTTRRDFDLDTLREIFSGAAQNWSTLGGQDLVIQPVIPLRGDEIREVFASEVMKGLAFSSHSLLAPTPEAALELLGEAHGAIGLVPYNQVPPGAAVARLRVPGSAPIGPEDPSYPLRLTLLAIGPSPPSGLLYDWLAWIQATQSD
ncbi:MAG TPA: hypothetical protein ENL35_08070 [Chloroflexi bacterium]|nr:hypothetical protein [Chloroflexota bacterium]